jgi:dienelactone hydrolase
LRCCFYSPLRGARQRLRKARRRQAGTIVVVASGPLKLQAIVHRPDGPGPFPAVLFNHGSGLLVVPDLERLGDLFARHGYVFLCVNRRGQGLSSGQGVDSAGVLDLEREKHGQDASNRLQLQLLETDQLGDAGASLAFLRSLPEVDSHRIAVVGHSFGGSLTLLLAERDRAVRAMVVFGGAAASWPRSAPLRARLLAAVNGISVSTLLVYAANDYSLAAAHALDAEMSRLAKPHELRIYPASGGTAAKGHNLVFRAPATWEHDVFAFLDEHVRPGP